jgi:hypothetical protein
MAQRAWMAFKRIWVKWKTPHDLEVTWPFALLGEAVIEREDDPPGILAYHTGGFTYPRQPLDILCSFILYHLWTERCREHFDDNYSLKAVLTQAWVATVEVGMASWMAIKSQRPTKDPDIQASIKLDFRREWLQMNITGTDNVATPLWPSVRVKPNTWKSWGFGVLRDSRMFTARQQGAKHLALGCSWCH